MIVFHLKKLSNCLKHTHKIIPITQRYQRSNVTMKVILCYTRLVRRVKSVDGCTRCVPKPLDRRSGSEETVGSLTFKKSGKSLLDLRRLYTISIWDRGRVLRLTVWCLTTSRRTHSELFKNGETVL